MSEDNYPMTKSLPHQPKLNLQGDHTPGGQPGYEESEPILITDNEETSMPDFMNDDLMIYEEAQSEQYETS
jgi:hypothetical protein